VGSVGVAALGRPSRQGLAVTEAGADAAAARRSFAVAAFNGAWALIDKTDRTADDDRQMLTLAFASRWHWGEVGTEENQVISDWQVAHVASLVGDSSLALSFAHAAYDKARSANLPDWMRASTAEGLARAHACAGDHASYQQYADEARELCASVDDEEDRELILGQLASIPTP
jgi:hypothetical protein